MSGARKTVLLAAGLFVLNAVANAPLFLPGEHKYRDSIEGGYASMARFVSEHPDPFGWNPLQYRGLPTHDWYLPAVPYAGALAIRLLPNLKPEHAYRLLVVTLTCLGPVTMFLFVVTFTGQRKWALLSALGYTLCSAGYLLFPAIKADQGFTYVPWRIQVLVKYGEGPHNVGLMLLPLALIACWRSGITRHFAPVAVAGLALAAVVLTNWVAAVALAWCVLMLLLSGLVSQPVTGFLGSRVLLASAAGYLFAAFWLTPSYIATTFLNWPTDAFNFQADSLKYLLAACLLIPPLAIGMAFRRHPDYHYLCFVLLCLAGFGWIVGAHYWWHIDIIPEARRYAIELEFFLFASIGEFLRIVLPGRAGRRRDWTLVAAGFGLCLVVLQPWTYLTRTWVMLRPAPRAESIEYRVAERLEQLHPRGRVFVSGGTRFRLNSWYPIPQLGGTFESGLRNRIALNLYYQIQHGLGRPATYRASDALNMLRVAGVEYMALHGPGSREHWRDVSNTELVTAHLESVWSEGPDSIYRVPFNGLASFVSQAELPPGLATGRDAGYIEPYVRSMDRTDRPRLQTTWKGTSRISITAPSVPPELLISVRVSHDAHWRAQQDGVAIPVRRDQLGNLLLEPRATAGPSVVQLDFGASREQMAGSAVSILAALGSLGWAFRRQRVT